MVGCIVYSLDWRPDAQSEEHLRVPSSSPGMAVHFAHPVTSGGQYGSRTASDSMKEYENNFLSSPAAGLEKT